MIEKSNSKRTWLFVRGLLRNHEHWLDFPDFFRAAFPGDQILMIDLPGSGDFAHQSSPLNISEYADHLRANYKFESDSKLYVVAMSLGAMAVVNWMQRFPGEITQAILINTSCANLVALHERLQPKMLFHIFKIASEKNSECRQNLIFQMVSQSHERQRQWKSEMHKIEIKYPFSKAHGIQQLIAASRAKFPPQAPGNVAIISSAGDRMVNPRASEKIAKIWKKQVIQHPWAGHDLPFDDPQWLVDQIQKITS